MRQLCQHADFVREVRAFPIEVIDGELRVAMCDPANPKLLTALRERFGPELLLGGNIPKEAVIEGPDAIDAEIERLEGFKLLEDYIARKQLELTEYNAAVGESDEIDAQKKVDEVLVGRAA